jgi:ADP-heptose:LPS heptosyltransferase
MNVRLLQRIDRFAGVPICFCLTLARMLLGRRPLPGPALPRRILFVKLAEQGSTVLAIPAIRRAIQMVGRENVFFVAFEENRFILDLLELVPEQNVITISDRGLLSMALSALKALGRLRGLQLDAAIDMEFFSRGSAAITFLSGAKARVGFHAFFGGGPYRGDLMTHRLSYNSRLHTTANFRLLAEALTLDPAKLPVLDFAPPEVDIDFPVFVPMPGEIDSVQAMLPLSTGGGAQLVLLNPNASDLVPLRQWPRERYVELANRLLADFPEITIVFTGASNEADEIGRLARQVGGVRCISLAGKTTLRQLMVLYTLSDVLVTNDSGPAHFASLTQIHVVTLFGPETPALFAAPTVRNLPLWAGLSCSPCVNAYNNRQSVCRDNRCMKLISVNQVFSEVRRILKQRALIRNAGIPSTKSTSARPSHPRPIKATPFSPVQS